MAIVEYIETLRPRCLGHLRRWDGSGDHGRGVGEGLLRRAVGAVVGVHVILQRSVEREGIEAELLHLGVSLVGRPRVVVDPIDGGHLSRAMTSLGAMYVDRPIARIVG